MSKLSIKRVFIANRGEIVRRVAEGAKKLGIQTVCLTSGVPPNYLLGLIDEFITVSEETVSLYLDQDKILSYATQAKCDAIHPGFGFLAENPDFAAKVEKAKLLWIGPSSKIIRLMADKSKARELAGEMKVPCIKGLNHYSHSKPSERRKLAEFCEEVSFPLLIKAAFGGGGKGMRIVRTLTELDEKIETASREAKSSFGNDTLVIEEYIEESRHVEVQVIGDKKGQIKILGDRDCSIQRRHQKIIEEAPAYGLSDGLRTKLHEAAYNLASGISYTSCGTVEFLVPWSSKEGSNKSSDFYFLEMNTRLQVEHPVTEEIFSVDIVALQFEVASGLDFSQNFMDKKPSNYSVEARIYLEDPKRNFMPAPNFIAGFLPFKQKGVRWEVGVDTVDKVSNQFDPMIAKIIATARNRKEAFFLLKDTLQKTFLATGPNNLNLLSEIFTDHLFISGAVSTSYLKHNLSRLLGQIEEKEKKSFAYLADISDKSINFIESDKAGFSSKISFDLSRVTDLSYSSKAFYSPKKLDKIKENQLVRKSILVNLNYPKECVYYFCFLNTLIKKDKTLVHMSLLKKEKGEKIYFLGYNGFVLIKTLKVKKWSGQKRDQVNSSNEIIADVPGKIVKVLIKKREEIKQDQSCFVLESMKMEFEVKSPTSCTVKEVLVKEGEQVESGKILAILDT